MNFLTFRSAVEAVSDGAVISAARYFSVLEIEAGRWHFLQVACSGNRILRQITKVRPRPAVPANSWLSPENGIDADDTGDGRKFRPSRENENRHRRKTKHNRHDRCPEFRRRRVWRGFTTGPHFGNESKKDGRRRRGNGPPIKIQRKRRHENKKRPTTDSFPDR